MTDIAQALRAAADLIDQVGHWQGEEDVDGRAVPTGALCVVTGLDRVTDFQSHDAVVAFREHLKLAEPTADAFRSEYAVVADWNDSTATEVVLKEMRACADLHRVEQTGSQT